MFFSYFNDGVEICDCRVNCKRLDKSCKDKNFGISRQSHLKFILNSILLLIWNCSAHSFIMALPLFMVVEVSRICEKIFVIVSHSSSQHLADEFQLRVALSLGKRRFGSAERRSHAFFGGVLDAAVDRSPFDVPEHFRRGAP
jgi:hypothetical protein